MSPINNRSPEPFVFHDPGGRRWPRLRRLGVLLGILTFLALIGFVRSIFVTPELRLPPSVRNLKGQIHAIQQQALAQTKALDWQKYAKTPIGQPQTPKPKELAGAPPRNTSHEIRAAFFVDWDPGCLASLSRHGASLTHVCPEWGTFSDANGHLNIDDNPRLQQVATARNLVIMPILSNRSEHHWEPEFVESLANGPAERRARFIVELLTAVQNGKAGGVTLDFEQIDPTYRNALAALIEQTAKALHSIDKELWLMIPMGEEIDTFDLTRLSDSVDHFVALLTDENSDEDSAGPIASEDWFEGWLQVIQEYGKPQKWIATIGAYGYDWTQGKKKAETISFLDAMSRASFSGIKSVEVAPPTYNPVFSYQEPAGNHTVCFLDAVTFLNQLRATRDSELGGIAIQRLGTEDPQLWDVLAMPDTENPSAATLRQLGIMRTADTVTNVGTGEMVTVDDTRHDGRRVLKLNDGRYIATYQDFPACPTVFHEGAGDEHAVSLTFDDGPDPKWTPQILDILKAQNIKATFFLVGSEAETYPGIVQRILREGHEIGNHSYTHPNLSEISSKQITFEFNATQRLLESITGRSTTLCRPPYNADSRPTRLAELQPLMQLQDDLGYLIVLENIDPEDWAKPGVDEIVQRVKDQRDLGNVVLLHDAGGNRSQTVEALPKIIDYLQTRGDHLVPLSELLHIPRDELMPLVKGDQDPMVRMITSVGFSIWRWVEQMLWAFMISATAVVVIRGLIVAALAACHHRREDQPALFTPPVSIIIAAYNEEKVIEATLNSVLENDYPGEREIIVVDDGSSDGTVAIVEKIAARYPNLHLICQPNSGKSVALRTALAAARHEILVFLDADTRFDRNTIGALVEPLANENVGAVSGHAKVGNLRTFIARCQGLEYTCGFNLDRRAYSVWNCITVVPGAVSAIRRSALEEAGGFSPDTLAEDTDLTLSLHKTGFKVAYAHDAIAWTEAPETIAALSKQRIRWAFGTLQCLWKHRDIMFNPEFKALGWFALPSIWFCQILLMAITPIVDVLLIFSLLSDEAGAMGLFFVTFLAMDMLLAVLACRMDDEAVWKAWRILPMRFIYRPLLSWVIWRSILKAFKGALVTWGKLERTANVEVGVS